MWPTIAGSKHGRVLWTKECRWPLATQKAKNGFSLRASRSNKGLLIPWFLPSTSNINFRSWLLGQKNNKAYLDKIFRKKIKLIKMLTPWKKSYNQPRQHIKKQSHYFPNKGPSSQSYGFSSSHVWMWELDYKESWAPKNWCFWTVALEKSLESPLDSKKIQAVHPKGNQSLIFIGMNEWMERVRWMERVTWKLTFPYVK